MARGHAQTALGWDVGQKSGALFLFWPSGSCEYLLTMVPSLWILKWAETARCSEVEKKFWGTPGNNFVYLSSCQTRIPYCHQFYAMRLFPVKSKWWHPRIRQVSIPLILQNINLPNKFQRLLRHLTASGSALCRILSLCWRCKALLQLRQPPVDVSLSLCVDTDCAEVHPVVPFVGQVQRLPAAPVWPLVHGWNELLV